MEIAPACSACGHIFDGVATRDRHEHINNGCHQVTQVGPNLTVERRWREDIRDRWSSWGKVTCSACGQQFDAGLSPDEWDDHILDEHQL